MTKNKLPYEKIFTKFLLFAAIVFYSWGCADKIVTESDLIPITTPSIQLSKFSEIQKNIFTPTCALAGCHSGPNPQANLDLSEGKAYSNLVNVQSVFYPSYKRVVPGNKEQSLLYLAINYSIPQIQMPLSGGKLNQYLIDSIGVWIDKGALND